MSIAILHPGGMITQPTNEERERFRVGDLSLQWLQEQVAGPSQTKGWIEVVRLSPMGTDDPTRRYQMIVNEEGLLLQLPINWLATLMYTAICQCKNTTPIAGTAIILTGDDCLD